MFARIKQCNLSYKLFIRLNNFLYIFNLRQGTILIAIHQIALSSFVLIILLVGIAHVGEMLTLLHSDMEDDAERRGFYELEYGDEVTFHEGDVISTNNQKRFARAQHLATVTVIFLYTTTILTSIYLMCCISLLHGAIKYKREYVLPWIMAACASVTLLIVAIVVCDRYTCLVKFFGGRGIYYSGSAIFVLTFIYAICAVSSFALEIGSGHCRSSIASDERGERLLLLDHAANSNLLSTAQLFKLSHGTRSQFV